MFLRCLSTGEFRGKSAGTVAVGKVYEKKASRKNSEKNWPKMGGQCPEKPMLRSPRGGLKKKIKRQNRNGGKQVWTIPIKFKSKGCNHADGARKN